MLTLEQLRERKNGIGGSDAAGVCGVSKYKTPVQVYLDKICEEVSQEENPIFERGNVLEPLVREYFTRSTGKSVNTTSKTIRSQTNPFMIANIDGFIPQEQALLEIKTCNYFAKEGWGECLTDQIPNDYLLQVQHYLAVTETKKAFVAVLFGDEKTFQMLMAFIKLVGVSAMLGEDLPLDIQIYKVERNEKLINGLIDIERTFWVEHVEKKVAPSWEVSADIVALFPKAIEGVKRVAEADDLAIISQLKEEERILKELIKPHEEKIEGLKCKLLLRIGEAEELVDIEGKKIASWKNMSRNLLDSSRLKAEMPDVYARFMKTSHSRRLSF